MQLDHYSSKFNQHIFPITLLCDNVTNAPNIGSLFRICDAFGVAQLIFCGEQITIGRKVMKTSRATEKVVKYRYEPNIVTTVNELKDTCFIAVLEITTNSVPIHQFKFDLNKPVTLIVGDENYGVNQQIVDLADAVLHIDMFGQNSSMNVVQATNIALYEITKQLMR